MGVKEILKNYLNNYDVQAIVINNHSVRHLVVDSENLWESTSDFIYTLLDDGTYSIRAAVKALSGNIVIPDSFNGRAVTLIEANGFAEVITGYANVTIPNTITSIGDSAFSDCINLQSVTFSNTSSLKSIGQGAFANCYLLESINLPNTVERIGSNAFNLCKNLQNITIPGSLTTIEKGTFAYCLALSSITIPKNVTTLEAGVFTGCSSLTSAVFSHKIWSLSGQPSNLKDATSNASMLTGHFGQLATLTKYTDLVAPEISVIKSGVSTIKVTFTNNNPVGLSAEGMVTYYNGSGNGVVFNLMALNLNSNVVAGNGGTLTLSATYLDREAMDLPFDIASVKAYFEEYSEAKVTLLVDSTGAVGTTRLLAPQYTSMSQDTPTEYGFSVYNPNDVQVTCNICIYDASGTVLGSDSVIVAANSSKSGYVEIAPSSVDLVFDYSMQFTASGYIKSEPVYEQLS